MNRVPALLAYLALACACAAGPQPQSSSGSVAPSARAPTSEEVDAKRAANGDKLVCEMVRPTGSHIREQQCRWVSTKEQERRAAQEALRNAGQQRGREGGAGAP